MKPIEIVDTAHMSHFVSEFYKSNVEFMKQREMPAEEEQMEEELPKNGEEVELLENQQVRNFVLY
jgi:hypothetical protein